MQAFTQLVYFDLPIPVWHIVIYVGCISFLMMQRRFKLAIVTSYVLVARAGCRAGAGSGAPGQRRHRQRHHHVAALHCWRHRAVDHSEADHR